MPDSRASSHFNKASNKVKAIQNRFKLEVESRDNLLGIIEESLI